jgi:hypothetical protein
MPIRKLPAGEQAYDAATYVGTPGRLFYDEDTGVLRRSDGVTPGGLPIPFTIASSTVIGGVKPGAGFTVTAGGTLSLNAGPMFELDESDVFQLKAGTSTRIGGIKAGAGVNITPDGTLTIDLDDVEAFSFGDFTATVGTYADSTAYALLGSVNENEDVVIASNGTGMVNIVGEFHVHRIDGTVEEALEEEPVFRILSDGQIQMLVPSIDSTAGALEIIGNAAGAKWPPNQTGVIVHSTGNQGLPNRFYLDADDNYALIVGRRYNGSVESPEGVQSGDVLLRIAAQGLLGDDGAGYTQFESLDFAPFGVGRLEWVATEDQFFGAQGGEMRVYAVPNGSPGTNPTLVASFNGTTGVTSSVGFVGDLTGNADTATTATNLAAATSILAGTLNVDPPAIGKNGSATATYTLTGLTTNHKVVVMPQAALPNEFNITASWASATNTLSIQYQTYGGGVDAAAFDIAYWAWV